MTDNLIQFEGGDILANLEERTITGLLIPFNEVGRTNIGRFQVEAGAVELPADPIVIGINTDHDPTSGVGRATKVWQEERGIMATFSIAKGPKGDAALADAISPTGERRKLSGEFGPAFIKAGKLVAGTAHLWGAALVKAGAFPSAQVLAADTADPAPAIEGVPAIAADDPAHVVIAVDTLPTDITATTPDGSSAVYEPNAAPAQENNTEGASNVTATATPAGAPAAVPPTIPGAPQVLANQAPATTEPRPVDRRQVFAAIAAVKANPNDQENVQILAALSDIKFDGTGALPASGVLQPNWLGSLDTGAYVREYIDLGNLGTAITAGGKSGYKTKRGTTDAPIAGPAGIPNGGNWTGNKGDINSYDGRTQLFGSSLRRFAVGNDIAREFYDLPGGAEVVDSFISLLQEDYMYWSDMWALYDLISQPGAPVAADTYPTNYPSAVGMLIQGILAVKKRKDDGRRDVPTFAIANDTAYAALAYAAGGEQNLPAFVNLVITTASKGTVDGNVNVVQGDNGITDTASVTVGAKAGIDFDEIAGGPLVVNALELARGGIDRAVHGYLQTFPRRSEAFVTIGTADTRANSTDYALGRLIKASSVVYRVVAAGTTGASAPTAPAVGATVTDGTATLLRLV
ncbi:hypothetical protein [Parafrigoribacterium humi]|uniref:hypothetical protein n=1 Tax=Parafrigoribacterium humi TaxID=3144664 RepID=UPI0032EC149F